MSQQFGPAGLNVRVGVHAQGTILGITVNITAHMERTAPPGGLRIRRHS